MQGQRKGCQRTVVYFRRQGGENTNHARSHIVVSTRVRSEVNTHLVPRAPLQSLNACSQRRRHIFFFSLCETTGPLFLFSFPRCLRPEDTRKVVEMASRFDKSGYRADHLSELLPSELTIRLLSSTVNSNSFRSLLHGGVTYSN